MQVRNLAEGPQVEKVGLVTDPATGAIRGIGLIFTTYLDNTRALLPTNYVVSTIGRNSRPGPRVVIADMAYNEVYRIVSLIFATPLPRNTSFRLHVVGTAPNGLTDRAGNFLAGSPDVPRQSTGSDFDATFLQGVQVQNPTTQPSGRKGHPRVPRRVRALGARSLQGPGLGGGRLTAR